MKNQHTEMSRLKIVFRLFRMVKPVKWMMVWAITWGVINHLSNIALLTTGAWLVSSLLVPQAAAPGAGAIALLFALGILKAAASYLEQLGNHDVAFRLLAHLRTSFYRQLEPLVPAKLLDKRSGDIVSRIAGDIEIIEVFFAHTISPFAIAAIVSAAVLAFLSAWWWVLPLAVLPFQLILGVVVPAAWERYVRKTGQKLRSSLGETNAYLTDSLQGLEAILLFNQGPNRKKMIDEKGMALNTLKRGHAIRQGWLIGVSNSVILLANLVVLYFAVQGYLSGALTLQGMLTATVATISAFTPLLSVALVAHYLTESLAAGERLFSIIDEDPAVVDAPAATAELPRTFDIRFKDVSFSYAPGGRPVIQGLDLFIPQGQSIAIVGESGSGKSTILRLLMRFWEFDSGRISIGDRDIRSIRQRSMFDMIALVSPDSHLFDATIRENIALAKPGASMREIITAAQRANIHKFIMTLPKKYDTPIGELGDMLSGGERQRIVISRALLKNPPILLFDEPTSNLDYYNENAIQETINDVCRDKTVIIVTHRLSLLSNVDRAYRLQSGELLEMDIPEARTVPAFLEPRPCYQN